MTRPSVDVLARPRVRRLRRRPAAVARAGRRERRRRCSTSARGTGRVALDLARRGHEVVALDRDPELLAALRERARAGCPSRRSRPTRATSTSAAASRSSSCRCRRSSCSAARRAARGFLACARAHLAPGGLLAAALADALEAFDDEHDEPPQPDVREVGRRRSTPAARSRSATSATRVAIERLREIVAPRRRRAPSADDVVELDRVERRRARGRGGAARPARRARARGSPQTDEYVGSDGGDAPCLSGRCASARCIPTS